MLATFFRLVLFAFIAYVVFLFLRIARGLKQARGQAGPQPPRPVESVMVKDEVCGTYIPRDEALTEIRDGREHYFCSEECRRRLKSR
jgi:YHS domain-containing protein